MGTLLAPVFDCQRPACCLRVNRANQIDQGFTWLTLGSACLIILLMVGFFVQLFFSAGPAIGEFGIGFLWGTDWVAPVEATPGTAARGESYGAWPALYGTLVTTVIAMVVALPASFLISMYLVEVGQPWFTRPMSQALDLLAAVPSIIYGMVGFFLLAPFMQRTVQPFLNDILGFLPIFDNPGNPGSNLLTAGLVLALMILPYLTAITRDTFSMVPAVVKESAYGAGATTWEVTRDITMRYGLQGLIGAFFLGLGRALGETMAVLFIIGNVYRVNTSLFDPGTTIASTLANNFGEAQGLQMAALFYLALILLAITFLLQVAAQWWLAHVRRQAGGGL